MTRLYPRSRASRDAAMWAAVARDQRAEVTERPSSVVTNDADEARDARRFDTTSYVRISGEPRDADEVPAREDER